MKTVYKTIAFSLLTSLSISSCIVPKKQFDMLTHENMELTKKLNQSNQKNRELKKDISTAMDSISDYYNSINTSLISENKDLKSSAERIKNELNQQFQSEQDLKKQIFNKDSINQSLIEKLNWIRKTNALFQQQLEASNIEKQDINKLLLDCIKQNNTNNKNKISHNNSKIIEFSNKQYEVYIARSVDKVKMGLKNKDSISFKSLGNLIDEQKADAVVFATNAGMYLKNNEPKGLYIENEKTINPVDSKTSGYGNFYMQPNGIFYIKKDTAYVTTTTDFIAKNLKNILFATQSGPMLLINKKINTKFSKSSKHLNIRSGVGVNNKNQVIFIKSNIPVTFYELALLFKEKYNCNNALYLDGVISRMYLPEINKIDKEGNFGPIIFVTK